MSVLKDLFSGTREDRSALDGIDIGLSGQGAWAQGMVWQSSGGVRNVSVADSMRLSAVFACLRLLSEAVATLPLGTFIESDEIRQPYGPTPDYLTFQPPQMSRVDYLSQVMLSLLTNGNAYVLTPRDALGIPTALIPLDPGMMKVTRDRNQVKYTIQGIVLDPVTDLLHIKGMSLPGDIVGMSPIAYARETIGLGLAAQRFGEAFFDNGALPSAVIQTPGDMTDGMAERFAASWNGKHSGLGNAQKVGVLTGGATLAKVSISPDEAQFLQTRAFQVPDVARIFGVPPHLIADASNSTSWGSGLAEQNLAFGQFSLRPWITRIEEAHTRLLTTHGLPNVLVHLNMDAILRASLKDRYASYNVGIVTHFLTINEARRFEGLPPVPWGNEPFVLEKVTETGPIPPDQLGFSTEQATPSPDTGGTQ